MSMTPQDLIIDRPALQSRRQRAVSSVVTLVAWTVWIYFWLPVVTFLGWVLGIRFFRREMLLPEGYVGTLYIYLGVVVLLAVVFIGWSLYNLGRFRGLDRRKARPPVEDAEMATRFEVSLQDLRRLRDLRRMVFHFSEEGKIVRIEEAFPEPPLSAPEEASPPATPEPEVPSPALP